MYRSCCDAPLDGEMPPSSGGSAITEDVVEAFFAVDEQLAMLVPLHEEACHLAVM